MSVSHMLCSMMLSCLALTQQTSRELFLHRAIKRNGFHSIFQEAEGLFAFGPMVAVLRLFSDIKPFTSCHLTFYGVAVYRRDLVYNFYFAKHLFMPVEDAKSDCHLLVEEKLPSGVFVDPYQLDSLRSFEDPKVLILDMVDIEKPEYLSQPIRLYIFANLYETADQVISNVTLPVHFRYHRPETGSEEHVPVFLDSPEIYIHCDNLNAYKGNSGIQISAPCTSTSQAKCFWFHVSYETDTERLELWIPVGHFSHQIVVIFGTLCVTVIGCVVVGMKVHKKEISQKYWESKES